MANQEHLDILKQGVEVWNKWRKEHPEIQPDLEAANLRKANLERANLYEANLIDTNLTNTNLTGCRIFGISAWKVNLEGAIQKDLTPPYTG